MGLSHIHGHLGLLPASPPSCLNLLAHTGRPKPVSQCSGWLGQSRLPEPLSLRSLRSLRVVPPTAATRQQDGPFLRPSLQHASPWLWDTGDIWDSDLTVRTSCSRCGCATDPSIRLVDGTAEKLPSSGPAQSLTRPYERLMQNWCLCVWKCVLVHMCAGVYIGAY